VPEHMSSLPNFMGEATSIRMPRPSSNNTTVGASLTHDIPIWKFDSVPDNITADVILVACFPCKLPKAFLSSKAQTSLNIHPSWLPDYRGPAPLFWQLRDGVRNPGITVHHLTAEIDAGDIVTQKRVYLPEGASSQESDRLLAHTGAALVINILNTADFTCKPQMGAGSHQSWPTEEDWHIPTDWTVQRAFNFMRGTDEWQHPFTLLTQPKMLVVRHAADYVLGPSNQGSAQPIQIGWRVGFSDGWLTVI
jgi:methionyl-tRNA formyltransferase